MIVVHASTLKHYYIKDVCQVRRHIHMHIHIHILGRILKCLPRFEPLHDYTNIGLYWRTQKCSRASSQAIIVYLINTHGLTWTLMLLAVLAKFIAYPCSYYMADCRPSSDELSKRCCVITHRAIPFSLLQQTSTRVRVACLVTSPC